MDKNLDSGDIRTVNQNVLPAKEKWRNIGIALGLSHQTLQGIHHKHKDRTDQCLFATLSAWLHGRDKAREKGTTWRSIIRVLRSKNVGESSLADKLAASQKGAARKRMPKIAATQPMQSLHSYKGTDQPKSEHCDSESPKEGTLGVNSLSKLMKILNPIAANWELFAVQIGVPKQEVDSISASIGPVPKRASKCLNEAIAWWLNNDSYPSCKKIVAVLRGTVVPNRDVAKTFVAEFEGVMSDTREAFKKSTLPQNEEVSSQSENVHVTVEPMLEKHLRSYYSRQTPRTKEEWPPTFDVEYINLVLVQQRALPAPKHEAKEMIALTTKGQLHFSRGPRLNLEDIVLYRVNRKVIIITGAPGVGKTTLALKLSREWAQDHFLTEFWIVLYIPLREPIVRLAESLEDLLKYYGKSCNESDIEKIKQRQGNGVLVILDGWDELRESCRGYDQFFPKLIRGEIYQLAESNIIVTSRPGAIENIRKHANRFIEILGFTEDQVKEYIHSYFRGEDSSISSKLLKDLEDYPNVASTCYIAVNLAIVCYVYYALGFNLPPTLTEVYESFVLHTLLRHFRKWEERIPSVDGVEDFAEPVKETLRQLGELALSGLKNDDLSFSRKELFKKCHVDETEPHFDGFGLLKPVPISLRTRIETFYHFLHLTIQEFIAAYYIIRMEEEMQIKWLTTNFSNVRYQSVIKFFCGMNHFKSTALRIFFKSITPRLIKDTPNTFFLECIYEGQWDKHCEEVAVHYSNRFCFTRQHFDPHQWQVLSYVIARSGVLWHFQCDSCHLGERELKCLCRFLETSTKSLNVIRLFRTLIDDQGVIYMAKILQSQVALSELVLSESNLSDNAFYTLCSALEDHQCIQTFTLRDNNISFNTADALSRLLMKLPALQKLELDIKNFSSHEYDIIIKATRSINSSVDIVTPSHPYTKEK